MGRSTSATISQTLTAYAQGFSNSLDGLLGDFLAPEVQVSSTAGQYKIFNDLNSFTTYNTERAMGGDANRIKFSAADGTFNCAGQALEITVDQKEREDAGDSPLASQLLDQGKIKALLNATRLSHDKKIIDAILTATAAEADLGVWSNPDIDPIDQLDKVIDDLAIACGSFQGIRLAIGMTPWRTLRAHPKVKARCNGVQVGGITLEQLKGMLIFPVDIRAGMLVYNSAKLGQSVSKARMLGSNVLVTFASQSPTVYDPSGWKVFTTGSGRVDAVRTYTDQSERFDVHAIDWSEDVKQTSTIATKRLAIT